MKQNSRNDAASPAAPLAPVGSSPERPAPGTDSSPVTAEIVRRVRAAIVEGTLGSGAELTEKWLTQTYGSSRTTARDVLRLLAKERLVELRPYRSARVRSFTGREIEDIFEARLLLEGHAARGCASASGEALEALRKALEAYVDVVGGDDVMETSGAHRDLHVALVATTGNTALMRCEDDLMLDSTLIVEVVNFKRDDIAKMRREHERLAAAFLERDAERAEQLVREHLRMVSRAAKDDVDAV
ncbi:GntR family transcriptional regulator [Rothia halotolerans]|uniref:GntR family transcriptional regulator n=1 Tax=Rothia halotolerans TaxID=405770 RepID=UPI00101C882F|nr:GntR family transcriptional regulator [Rothia halotolerans]